MFFMRPTRNTMSNRRAMCARHAVAACWLVVAVTGGASGCERESLTEEQISRAVAVAAAVDRDQLQGHVEALVQERAEDTLETSPWGDGKPLARGNARDYVRNAFAAAGLAPVEEVTTMDGLETANVFVDIPGVSAPDEIVILGAHYDCWYLGADDNASGVAVLLEAARILAQSAPPARTIRIIAFDREEEGLIGSHRYTDAHADERVVAVVNLDAVAYSDSTPGSQKSLPGIPVPDTGDFLAVLGSAETRTMATQMATLSREIPDSVYMVGVLTAGDSRYPGLGDLMRSDHAWFWLTGVPALMLTDTANFRNPHYHYETDLPDTLDYDFLASVARLAIGSIAAFAAPP
jgi:Peptidase family M28